MAFDADKFLNQTVNAPMSTSTVPVPEGEYKAIIDDGDKAISFREGGTDRNGNDLSPQCVVLFSILDDALKVMARMILLMVVTGLVLFNLGKYLLKRLKLRESS